MKYKCRFNPTIDVESTIEGLETDLELAIKSGVVLNTGLNPTYNDIDDPARIRGKIGDVFDAINAQRVIMANSRVTEPSTGTSQQTGSSQPIQSTPSEGQI